MSSLVLFLCSVGIFIVISGLMYWQAKAQAMKSVKDMRSRYKHMESQLEKLESALEDEKKQHGELKKQYEEFAAEFEKKDKVLRLILPSNRIEPIDIIRIKKLVSEKELSSARDYLMSSGDIATIEDVLVKNGSISKDKMDEIGQLAAIFNKMSKR